MSDHETEFSPMGSEATSDGTASYSSNGTDSGGFGDAGDRLEGDGIRDDGATFLADLAKAMQSTAASEQVRNVEGTEQRRQAHIDAIRAREALEAEDLRELAKEDVKGIDAWSDGEIKRIKLERERRIASRREQLQIRLEEHHAVIAREVEHVETAISAYRAEIDRFFNRLETETDPVEIARLAGSRPTFPVLELIGPDEATPTSEYPPVMRQAPTVSTAAAVAAEAAAEAEAVATLEPAATYEQAASQPEDSVDPSGSADQESEYVDNSELIGVEEPEEPETQSADSSEEPVGVAAEEPVGVAGESRVVMPRSTGAGSWLRWPSGSSDRSDSGQ